MHALIEGFLKTRWLSRNFGQVNVAEGKNETVASLPMLYTVQPYQPRERTHLTRNHTAQRDRFILSQVEAAGDSKIASLRNLCDTVKPPQQEDVQNDGAIIIEVGPDGRINFEQVLMGMFKEMMQLSKRFALYVPKENQSVSTVKAGEPLECVRNQDPLHQHGSPRLVDFLMVQVQPNSRVQKGSFDGAHSHFLIDP